VDEALVVKEFGPSYGGLHCGVVLPNERELLRFYKVGVLIFI
jgi:hypothetical protein